MSWKLSRYRTGDLVEVRSKDEVLATLDANGCLDNVPFMLEMLQYCGRQFRVGAVAHKTCDTAGQTVQSRKLQATVHLEGLRCDGSAHGGCQAECYLFWKDEWLKPADHPSQMTPLHGAEALSGNAENRLRIYAHGSTAADGASARYFCQATQMFIATQPLAWWDVRQYIFDVVTRNYDVSRVSRVLFLAFIRWTLSRAPFGSNVFKRFHDAMHLWLSGHPSPSLNPQVPDNAPTPTLSLGLQAGEFVRIKSQEEIEKTIDQQARNRGLLFDKEEMAPFCGGTYQVRKQVTLIIDEPTGKMLRMKQPCIMLEGVVCRSERATNRLNCPRAIPSYWREIWLDRIEAGEVVHGKFAASTAEHA
jgi:hypothetical protein